MRIGGEARTRVEIRTEKTVVKAGANQSQSTRFLNVITVVRQGTSRNIVSGRKRRIKIRAATTSKIKRLMKVTMIVFPLLLMILLLFIVQRTSTLLRMKPVGSLTVVLPTMLHQGRTSLLLIL